MKNLRQEIRKIIRESAFGDDEGVFKIFCEVYGGVTGHRMSYLKDKDGKEKIFYSRREAQNEVDRLYKNLSPYRTAEFHYSVEEM